MISKNLTLINEIKSFVEKQKKSIQPATPESEERLNFLKEHGELGVKIMNQNGGDITKAKKMITRYEGAFDTKQDFIKMLSNSYVYIQSNDMVHVFKKEK